MSCHFLRPRGQSVTNVPRFGSGGYPTQTGPRAPRERSEGYFADGYGLAAVNPLHHALTHKPTDSKCDSGMRGKMRNLRKYAGAFSRPITNFGDVVTMHPCSVYDHGVKYA